MMTASSHSDSSPNWILAQSETRPRGLMLTCAETDTAYLTLPFKVISQKLMQTELEAGLASFSFIFRSMNIYNPKNVKNSF